ncbi:hypothetical protein B0A55_02291 [Friedmanniomyces simplex]|uniref:Uncharacterized protein n=1 Tax=Friedmanniomyces simplex TaxID=329884 RepID=A0A4U0Y0H6_9PEZI|nr:hypothetical protein B0A55_02291 [Friedmanniomyces simplex]
MRPVQFPWMHMETARHAVILMHERFNLTDEQRLQLFKKTFLAEAQTLRPGAEIKAYSLSDAYKCRLRSDRKRWWVTHDGDRPSAPEKARREVVRAAALGKLQIAAEELGLPGPTAVKISEKRSQDDEEISEEDDAGDSMQNDVASAVGVDDAVAGGEALDHGDLMEVDIESDNHPAVRLTAKSNMAQQDMSENDPATTDLSELGRFASWPVVQLLAGTNLQMTNPDLAKLLNHCRTRAKNHKQSVEQYLERRLRKVRSQQAKAMRQGKPAANTHLRTTSRPAARAFQPDVHPQSMGHDNQSDQPTGDTILTNPEEHQQPGEISGPTLRMVHYRDCVWPNDSPRCHTGAFVDQTTDVYKAGGKVFRVIINNMPQDVMICQMRICIYCITGKHDDTTKNANIGPLSLAAASTVTNGLPFVHNGDVMLDGRGMPRYFKGTSRGWSPVFPKDMYPSEVDFTVDGATLKKVQVMACYARHCETCHRPVTVEDELAKYRPGGKVYEAQKAEEDKGEVRRKAGAAAEMAEEAEEMAVGGIGRAAKRGQGESKKKRG